MASSSNGTRTLDLFALAAEQHNLWMRRGLSSKEWTIAKAMRDVGFEEKESKDRTLQMRVRRKEEALKRPAPPETPAPILTIDTSLQSPISTITEASPSIKSSTASTSSVVSLHTEFLGGCRRTAKQADAARKAEQQALDTRAKLHKQCTSWIAEQKRQQSNQIDGARKKGVARLREEFMALHGIVDASTLPSVRSIQEAIQFGTAGQSPVRSGPKGNIAEADFKHLGEATAAYVSLCASNGDEKSYVDIKKTVNSVANSLEGKEYNDQTSYKLVERLFKKYAIDLKADKLCYAEARRILWTTREHLTNMFDQWRDLLIEKEFAVAKTNETIEDAVDLTEANLLDGQELFSTGELIFHVDQLRRIVNIDETCLSLDGIGAGKGGRPSLSFHNPNLPRAGKAASKCGGSATLVIGGNAAGEPTPPHFQFPSSAQEHNQTLKYSAVSNGRDVLAQFGHGTRTRLSSTYGMNEKGGMDEAHFEAYLIDLMYCLYPNVADVKGKRVIIKADQGPGRSNTHLLARLRARGIYLFPSVPNTSSVSQEMDQIFGFFKRLLRVNVELLHDALMKSGRSVSLGRDDCTLIVFGGSRTLEDGSNVTLEEAFDQAFSLGRILAGFAAVGAAPLTRKCLDDPKVRVELSEDSSEDSTKEEKQLRALGDQLETCVNYLLMRGFKKAELLLVKPKKKRVNRQVTLPHSQERLDAFNNAKTIGAKYKALNGTHCTHDDMFRARATEQRAKELKELEERKLASTESSEREAEAFALIDRKEREGYPLERLQTDQAKWKVAELNILIKWKLGKIPNFGTNKASKLTIWNQLKGESPAQFGWSDAEEARLQALKEAVTIEETELGKERRRLKQDAIAGIGAMSIEEMDQFLSHFNAVRAVKSSGDTVTTGAGSDSAGAATNETPSSNQTEGGGDDNTEDKPDDGGGSGADGGDGNAVNLDEGDSNLEGGGQDDDSSAASIPIPVLTTRRGRVIRKPTK